MVAVFQKAFVAYCLFILTAFLSLPVCAATIAVSTDDLIFPDVCPDYSVTETVSLTNTSSDPVTLSIWIQDNTWNQFSIISPDPLPDSLAGNGEVTLTIQFTPPFDTMFAGLLNIRANDDINDIAWVSLLGAGYCPNCTDPEVLCSGICVNVSNDPNNCGECGNVCSEYAVCEGGICQLNCGGLTECDGSCVDILSDPNNCGECENVCSEYATCTDGTCQLDCGELTPCGDTCVDISNDPNNCGACGAVCPGADSGTATCEEGICGFTECPSGFLDLSHCYDNARRVCIVDVLNYFAEQELAGNLYPANRLPRYDNFIDRLSRLRTSLLECRFDAACGIAQLASNEIDGVEPGSCRGGDECGGGGAVPDSVAGPSVGTLNGYLYDLTIIACFLAP